MVSNLQYEPLRSHLAIFNIYDDHEVLNNFSGEEARATGRYQNAISPFENYHAAANYDPIHKNHYYYDFKYGDVAFFVMDTRKHRTPYANVSAGDEATMLGDRQLRAFHSWLGRVR